MTRDSLGVVTAISSLGVKKGRQRVAEGLHATGDVTGINVISLAQLFTMRATHGQLIARLVCTSCVRGATRLLSSDEVVRRQYFSRERFEIGCH
jgi:hypothetical protein